MLFLTLGTPQRIHPIVALRSCPRESAPLVTLPRSWNMPTLCFRLLFRETGWLLIDWQILSSLHLLRDFPSRILAAITSPHPVSSNELTHGACGKLGLSSWPCGRRGREAIFETFARARARVFLGAIKVTDSPNLTD